VATRLKTGDDKNERMFFWRGVISIERREAIFRDQVKEFSLLPRWVSGRRCAS
jgi:hypothetical protein